MKHKHSKALIYFTLLLLALTMIIPTFQVVASNQTSGVDVYYKLSSAGDDISYSFYIQNNTNSVVDLSNLKVRYWYTRGQPSVEQVAKYCTTDQINNLVPLFITQPGYEKADTAFQLSFENYKNTYLKPGEKSFVVDVNIWEEGRALNQINDYSIITNNNSTTNFIYNPKITVYNNNVQISGIEPNFAAGPNVSTVIFTEENFKGNSINLTTGIYNTKKLESLGLPNNSASSILVKNGYKVTLFEYDNFNTGFSNGKTLIRTTNDPSFINNNFHKITSSIIVEKISEPLTIINEEENPKIPGGVLIDLGVSVSTDKMKYTDNQIITYTIEYQNNYNIETGPVVIKAQIPKNTNLFDSINASTTANGIEWNFRSLQPRQRGRVIYRVRVDELNVPEVFTSNTVEIVPLEDILENPENAKSSIQVLLFSSRENGGYHNQYIVGYPDGTFNPSNNITRAEIATVLARISGINRPARKGNIFPDVGADHWASGFIAAATQELGLFSGYPDGTFRPDAPITRGELATLSTKFSELGNPTPLEDVFLDSSQHWAKNFIAEAYRYRIIAGYPDGTFRPDNNIARAEAVTMINRMTYRGPLIVSTPTFPDVLKTNWAFGNVESAARSYEFVRTATGDEILKSETFLYIVEEDGLAILR
jgi:hypothetical protein